MSGVHVTNGEPVALFDGIDRNTDWTGAACYGSDPELWFPKDDDTATEWLAKSICAECPIIDRCREHAAKHPTLQGIWGGMTPRERERIRRGRKARP